MVTEASAPLLTHDHLLKGRVQLRQMRHGLRAGLDAVLLAAAIPAQPGELVLEAGCGSGAVFLCLLARVPDLRIIAIEQDPALADLARQNAALNGWADRVTVLQGDVADPAVLAANGSIDHACANPPFWPDGTPPPAGLRAAATHHLQGPGLDVWAGALSRPLRRRGTVTLVLPAGRHSEGSAALRQARCGAVSLLPLWPRAGMPAKRVILQGRREARSPDTLAPGLVLHDLAGWTEPVRQVLEEGAPLSWP
ncbi:tRNA1(Val) (adenine(37)-N6)-methyltransferase [Teichococcus vastitatis]|uniref:Methyltransferase n=1 Tax=Teichococcus vastitatis TaxID=2307076 RepID=A0ABS9W307_9PROT|nr:methyltransferase domain-containing protein [Pseudoroseomonas vastitatis]MCI0753325.1 methyltransferase [Pseudoroseomonas vastitatis]